MSAASGLNAEQREIVELLCGELAEALSADNTALYAADGERQQLLLEFTTATEQLSNAMELAGLNGLSEYCEKLSALFADLAESNAVFAEELIDTIASWPLAILNFLHQFIDAGSSEDTLTESVSELLAYLCKPCWPTAPAAEDISRIQAALTESSIIRNDDDNQAPLIIDANSSSLELGDDIRPELLQGLLAELPEQNRLFELSVNLFLRDGKIEHLLPAQRIAHTVKGAANIVGIRGLANLMHLCEDLFESITKGLLPAPVLASAHLQDTLINASDCLADCSDYLLGRGPKPGNVIAMLQTLVDFAAQQDSEVAPSDDDATTITSGVEEDRQNDTEMSIAEPSLITPELERDTIATLSASEQVSTPTTDDDAVTATLALSQTNAQQLLRIAGENQIANTQFMAQLDGMKTSIEQAERFHKQMKAMAMELEVLLQTQNALRSALYRSKGGEHADNATDLDPLEMESYSELHSFSNQLLELTVDSQEAVNHIEGQLDSLMALAYTQRQLNRDNNDLLLRTYLVPVKNIVPRLQRCIRQACRLTQKNAVLEITGAEMQIDNRVLNGIVDPLMHLLRNAVDHGIEEDEERIAQGKDATGTIAVEFEQVGEIINIHCRDNGRGLNYESIRAKALQQQLIDKNDVIDHNGLSRLLFLPGFSTRTTVSQTSGRGIGLDVVQAAVQQLKGSVQVVNNDNGGCCFSLSIPASMLTAHTLLVRIADGAKANVISVLSRGVDNILHIDPEQIDTLDGAATFYYQNTPIPVLTLADLLALPGAEKSPVHALLIVTRNDGSQVAIGVDKLVASQDLVIKPLNHYTYHPPGVVGATILGDGTVSNVVDIQALPGLNMSEEAFARLQSQRVALANNEQGGELQLPTALIIDDSLSARQSLAQFVSELGIQVRTAKDGFEAIAVMETVRPHVILVDLEMPRMNGLEFTAHLRADAATQSIPVIMITSRSTEKHRQLAAKAGVDDYLNKPWSDEALLSSLQHQMAKQLRETAQ